MAQRRVRLPCKQRIGPIGTLVTVALLFAFAAYRPSAAEAQEAVSVGGIVVDGGTGQPVFAILATLSGQVPILTDRAGRFRFDNVRPGTHTLSLSGVGHVPVSMTLEVRSDTTVVLEIDVAPVALDTLTVEARQVGVKGVVRDRAADVWLIDAEVIATPDFQARTDPIGRFNLGKVPSGVPVTMTVRSFGYLPETITLVPSNDTTVVFQLEEDPVAQAMIAEQMKRLDDRLSDRRYSAVPTLEREDLLKGLNGSVYDVLKYELGSAMYRHVSCVIIDERPRLAPWMYGHIHPDRIHRIEILEIPGGRRRRLLVRMYSRQFVEDMVNGRAQLVDRDLAKEFVGGECR